MIQQGANYLTMFSLCSLFVKVFSEYPPTYHRNVSKKRATSEIFYESTIFKTPPAHLNKCDNNNIFLLFQKQLFAGFRRNELRNCVRRAIPEGIVIERDVQFDIEKRIRHDMQVFQF